MDQNRYVITSNIAHFEAQLRGGLLDLGQTHIVTGLLAEAHAALDELDLHRAATHPASAPCPPPEPTPAAPPAA
jgi:hypothetical protein